MKEPTAMALRGGYATKANGHLSRTAISTGQRFYGTWMQDGRFYYPMTQPDGKIVICAGGTNEFGPIVEG